VPAPAPDRSTWKIDVTHSQLSFSIRHLLSQVRGKFAQWEGTVLADPKDWNNASITVTVQVGSISTSDEDGGNEERDNDLHNPDWFDTDKFPTMTFVSTKVVRKGDSVNVFGKLTMHGVTKPLVLAGKLTGMKKMSNGKYQAAFNATATLNRTDYGMIWNRVADKGVLVGNDVNIDIRAVMEQQ
jgi:polyisoprenoid-binding protein YceI